MTPQLPIYVDSTMMTALRSCPRKFYNEFVLGLRPPGLSIDLHAGGCFAKALEVARQEIFLKDRDLDRALLTAQAAFEDSWGDFVMPDYKKSNKTPDRVWEAVLAYFKQYGGRTDHIQPFTASGKPTFEFTFAIPLEPAIDWAPDVNFTRNNRFPLHPVTGDPFLYSGRIDTLGHLQNQVVVEDDKTKGTGFYGNWSESWDLRAQFIGYTWALQQMGIACDTVVVRGIGILKEMIHHAEVIKPYSDYLRGLWLEQTRRDLWRMVDMWQEGYWDYNMGESCTNYGNCIFLQSCQSSTPEIWLKNFTERRWNPLQSNPVSEEPKAA